MSITIWHNPRCSKSRETLALLEKKGINPIIRLYLEDTPDANEIAFVLKHLNKYPKELMRTKEEEYKGLGLDEVTDNAALIAAMIQTPKLIERPIVINGDKVAIGRPPESVLAIL